MSIPFPLKHFQHIFWETNGIEVKYNRLAEKLDSPAAKEAKTMMQSTNKKPRIRETEAMVEDWTEEKASLS